MNTGLSFVFEESVFMASGPGPSGPSRNDALIEILSEAGYSIGGIEMFRHEGVV
jgi:hypothetical protein